MRRVLAALLLSLATVPAASAEPAAPAPPAPSPSPAAREGKLKLEPWVDPYGKTSLPDIPRYRENVEVPGKAMDTASLTARMAWFMGEEWQPLRGAVPGGASAPRLEDTYPFRPRPAPAIDVQALLKVLADEIARRK